MGQIIISADNSDLVTRDEVNTEIRDFLKIAKDNGDLRFEQALNDAIKDGDFSIYFERGNTHLYGSGSNPSAVYSTTRPDYELGHEGDPDYMTGTSKMYISDEFLQRKVFYPDNNSAEDPVNFSALRLVLHEVKHAADIANAITPPQTVPNWNNLTQGQQEDYMNQYEDDTRAWVDNILDDYPSLAEPVQGDYQNTILLPYGTETPHDAMFHFDADKPEKLNSIDPEAGDPATAAYTDTFMDAVNALMAAGFGSGSPLALDIDGTDGVELTSLASANAVYWDVDSAKNDGVAEASGWVTGGDGLLAIDLNADGIINNSGELFGDQTGFSNGFLALAAYDSNSDGAITNADAAWGDLKVWIDSTLDGYSESTELHTLDSLSITSINLAYSNVSDTIAGNEIKQESTFVIGGNTRDIVDAYFAYSDINTVYDANYTPDINAYLIGINQRGYGDLPALHIAMSLDNTGTGNLLDLVRDFSALTFADLFPDNATVTDAVKDILFRWAGVDGVDPDSRGVNIDARELEFLEKLTGTPFVQTGSVGQTDPGLTASYELKEAFHVALNNFTARLMAQGAGGELFTGDVVYDIATDSFTGVTGISSTALDTLETLAAGISNEDIFWQNVVRMIEFSVGTTNLPSGDQTALNDAIYASNNSLSLTGIVDSLDYTGSTGSTYNGTTGNDTITAGSGDDTIYAGSGTDTLNGGQGGDTLKGEGDADTLNGGAGSDYLQGGAGNDIYNYSAGDGWDAIVEQSGTDKISFAAGIDAGDLTLSRSGTYGLVIDIDTGSQTGQILIENQFLSSSAAVETIQFSDTSTIDLTTHNYTLNGTSGDDTLNGVTAGGGTVDTINGGAGNDTIDGGAGNDTLNGEAGNDLIYGGYDDDTVSGGDGNDDIRGDTGNDSLSDGAGNDKASGGAGNDTFNYTSGKDVYDETSGTDSIVLTSAYTQAGTQYLRVGNDMQIYFDAANNITITGFFSTSGAKIETLDFTTGTDTNLTTVSTVTQGTSGNDTLGGTTNADVLYGFAGNDALNGAGTNGNDSLYGGTGNDTLNGGYGNDILDGGAGDDTLSGHNDNDTYYYQSGNDVLNELGGTDLVDIVAGWTLSDLSFNRYTTAINDLKILFGDGSVNTLILSDQLSNSARDFDTLRLHDGTSDIDISTLQVTTYGDSSANTINGITVGASADDIIYGGGGNDTIDGKGGNDVVYGEAGNDSIYGDTGNDTLNGGAGDDTLKGDGGDDTLIYTAGLDTVWDSGGTDTLKITGAWTVNDLSFSSVGTYDTKITLTASVDEITVKNLRHPTSSNYVDTVLFDDGFYADLPSYASWIVGTTGNDTVAGNSSANTLVGKAGTDTITAGSGNDAAHGGAGNDTVKGEGGNDLLHGGTGDDLMFGGDGLDTMYGGDGADSFIFEAASAFNNVDVVKDFSTAQNDALDLTDILTLFDPLTDAITDFVEITTSGADSILKVDRDGTAGTYSLVQIATIQGVTGLTDEAALVASGHLLAA